jgi:drug/metabolite transporter (DMT)-like permease
MVVLFRVWVVDVTLVGWSSHRDRCKLCNMNNRPAIFYALASAALFGLSTPAAKVLLGTIDPGVLAGLFYSGAGIGTALLRRVRPRAFLSSEIELQRRDIPWLAGAVLSGGVIGPLLLLLGLRLTDAATASLLLTMETVATGIIAWFVFREHFNARVALGMALLIAGSLTLAWSGTPSIENFLGPLAVIGACIAWGIDNNLTRRVSHANPLQIVQIKGLVAGPVNLMLALWIGGSMPRAATALTALVVGFVGYGLSIALFVLALRKLGSARTGAYFATAPFVGAVAAVIAFGELVTAQLAVAGCLMGAGVWLYATKRKQQ